MPKVIGAQGNAPVKRPVKQPAALKGTKVKGRPAVGKNLSNKVNLKKNSIGN